MSYCNVVQGANKRDFADDAALSVDRFCSEICFMIIGQSGLCVLPELPFTAKEETDLVLCLVMLLLVSSTICVGYTSDYFLKLDLNCRQRE